MSNPKPPSPSLARIPRDPEDDYSSRAVEARLRLSENAAGRGLPHLAGTPVPLSEAQGNIENLIGYMQVPVGIAGPLCVETSMGWRELYVPMATTEGAMVASYSRGMGLLRESGGARSHVIAEGLSQHPMLVYPDSGSAFRAGQIALAQREELEQIVTGISRHGRLQSIEPQVIGRRLILRLVFFTQDAIGINMAAHATDLIARHIAETTNAEMHYVHGQDVEKRANSRAFVEGRGRSVVAEVTVPREVLHAKARVTPEQMEAIQKSYHVGFANMGTQNWAIQVANGLAAVMLACGQDVAYLTESATGWLDLEVDGNGDLYAALTLPSLLVGTVGGGSGLPAAKECLDIMGCHGPGQGEHVR